MAYKNIHFTDAYVMSHGTHQYMDLLKGLIQIINTSTYSISLVSVLQPFAKLMVQTGDVEQANPIVKHDSTAVILESCQRAMSHMYYSFQGNQHAVTLPKPLFIVTQPCHIRLDGFIVDMSSYPVNTHLLSLCFFQSNIKEQSSHRHNLYFLQWLRISIIEPLQG